MCRRGRMAGGDAIRLVEPSWSCDHLRMHTRPTIESEAQAGDGWRVGEGDVQGMAIDRPELGRGQADRVEGALVLVRQGQVGHGRVVG